MHKSFLRKVALALATVMAVAFLPSAFAQITTTGITGSLRAADGKALAGVTVTATHNPTNANYTAVTTPAGRFNFIGLPVGGPFTLSAKTEGGEAVATDQFTTLGTDIDVALTVKSETIQLEKVVVGGSRSALDATATGSGVTLDAAQLAVKPTTERSFADLVSAAPQVTLQALSSANDREEAHIVALGQNNRFNSFMIDGARINDVFGLNGTGLAAFFNPISVDALNQMSVKVSPYDANYSFFTGAAINAVTKSGTNTFHGSAYYIFKGDHLFGIQMQGENPKEYDATGVKIVPRLDRETKGFTVARCNETLGCRFMNNGEMVFEDMFVPDDQLLVQDSAMGSAGVYFRPGKIIQAAKNLGVGVRAFEATADYVQNYVQGGRILIKHQAVALRLADMATKIEAVRALLDRASAAVDENAPEAETLVNMAKMFASEEIMKVAQHAVELHGGNGIMLDFGIEKVLRDAVIFMHMDATVDISKFKIVKNMFPQTAGKYAGPE